MTHREVCSRCLSSDSMETCLDRQCPLFVVDTRRTSGELLDIIERENIKLDENGNSSEEFNGGVIC